MDSLFDSLPDLPQAAANADPDTSHEAAERMTVSGRRQRHAALVLDLVRRFPGSTSVELHQAQSGESRLDRHEVSRRLADLKAMGLVRQGDKRTCRIRGTNMVTWFVVEGKK